MDILEFVRVLSPYLVHMHIHDNLGIPEVVDPKFGDQHLPLGQGNVENPKNLPSHSQIRCSEHGVGAAAASWKGSGTKKHHTTKGTTKEKAAF